MLCQTFNATADLPISQGKIRILKGRMCREITQRLCDLLGDGWRVRCYVGQNEWNSECGGQRYMSDI